MKGAKKEKIMHDNRSEYQSNIWDGTGQYFRKLQVQHLFDDEYRVIAILDPPSAHYVDNNSIITADSFEKAIEWIQTYDSDYWDEATLDGSGCEGG